MDLGEARRTRASGAPPTLTQALVRPSKKLPPGFVLTGGGLTVEFGDDLGEGLWIVRLDPGDRPLLELLAEVGLPPRPSGQRTM